MARMKATDSLIIQNNTPTSTPVTAFSEVQGDMSEDEALARALAASMQEAGGDLRARDTALARALARQRVGAGGDQPASRCTLS